MIIFITSWYCYRLSGMTYFKSDIDNNYYLVRDVDDKQNAANMLAKLKKNMFLVNKFLYDNLNDQKFVSMYHAILQLNKNISRVVLCETGASEQNTSYTINKGDEVILCIRSKDLRSKIYDINLLMYVVLHEMAHIACDEFGHTEKFKKIFLFICDTAIKLKLYNKIDFYKYPQIYCGIIIKDSII